MTDVDPLSVQCAACLARPGEPCHSVSSDDERPQPHRMRVVAIKYDVELCDHCDGMGWKPREREPAK